MPAEVIAVDPSDVQRALAAVKVGVWRRDPVRGLIHCNPAMCSLYGISRVDGRRGVPLSALRDALYAPDQKIIDRRDALAEERGGLMMTEYRVRRPDGSLRWIWVRGKYEARQPGWVMPGGYGIVIDITESRGLDRTDSSAIYLAPDALPSEDRDYLPAAQRIADRMISLKNDLRLLPDSDLLIYFCELMMLQMMEYLGAEDAQLAKMEERLSRQW